MWDAFTILSLIEDHQLRNVIFDVPDHGEQSHRFIEAMEKQNKRIDELGQEDMHHYCDKCMRITEVEGRPGLYHLLASQDFNL